MQSNIEQRMESLPQDETIIVICRLLFFYDITISLQG
jgi:hypothetical protein